LCAEVCGKSLALERLEAAIYCNLRRCDCEAGPWHERRHWREAIRYKRCGACSGVVRELGEDLNRVRTGWVEIA